MPLPIFGLPGLCLQLKLERIGRRLRTAARPSQAGRRLAVNPQ